MVKEDNENFKNLTKCRICDNDYTNNDVTVGTYRGYMSLENIEALHIEVVISSLD